MVRRRVDADGGRADFRALQFWKNTGLHGDNFTFMNQENLAVNKAEYQKRRRAKVEPEHQDNTGGQAAVKDGVARRWTKIQGKQKCDHDPAESAAQAAVEGKTELFFAFGGKEIDQWKDAGKQQERNHVV